MIAEYFYLNWENLLNNLKNAEKLACPEQDILDEIKTALPEWDMEKLLYLEKSDFFLPIPLKGYDWIELVLVPLDLTHYRRILELNDNVCVNKERLSEEDRIALEFIENFTFSRWGTLSDVFIEDKFGDYNYELYEHTSKIFANKTLSPNMITDILQKWEEHKFEEKMEVFGKEGHIERRMILLWIELLKATKQRSNWGLLYHWH